MNDWIQGMRAAIDYMEDHLTERMEMKDIAAEAGFSPFHFMRMFTMLTGLTVGEYIRNRRLTLAGQTLSFSEEKVVDVALRYGYETHEAFSKAFRRFHGVSPSQAREQGTRLKSVGKLSIQITLKGDTTMNYQIIEKESFRVVGKKVTVHNRDEESFKIIPSFCQTCAEDGTLAQLEALGVDEMGVMGICANFRENGEVFDYYEAVTDTGKTIPEEMETLDVPRSTWAVFESVGPIPKAIQDVWKRIFSEWFPSSPYEHANAPEIEVYEKGDMTKPDYRSYVWIPVIKKQ